MNITTKQYIKVIILMSPRFQFSSALTLLNIRQIQIVNYIMQYNIYVISKYVRT